MSFRRAGNSAAMQNWPALGLCSDGSRALSPIRSSGIPATSLRPRGRRANHPARGNRSRFERWAACGTALLFRAGRGFLLLSGLSPRRHNPILASIGDELAEMLMRISDEDVNHVPFVCLRAELGQQL